MMGLAAEKKGSSKRPMIHRWISYNRFETNPVKVPKGWTRKYLPKSVVEDRYYGSKKRPDEIEWPAVPNRGKSCYTLDNGDLPYLVYLGEADPEEDYLGDPPTAIQVFTRPGDVVFGATVLEKKHYTNLVLNLNKYQKVWTDVPDSSVLVQCSPRVCYFIGTEIMRLVLQPGDSVEDFRSPVGNSSVPYPVIIGNKNVYFMLDKTYLPKAEVPVTSASPHGGSEKFSFTVLHPTRSLK